MEETLQNQIRPSYMCVVVEDPDGLTYTQRINNDFDSLLELKKSLGGDYWIVDIFDPI